MCFWILLRNNKNIIGLSHQNIDTFSQLLVYPVSMCVFAMIIIEIHQVLDDNSDHDGNAFSQQLGDNQYPLLVITV